MNKQKDDESGRRPSQLSNPLPLTGVQPNSPQINIARYDDVGDKVQRHALTVGDTRRKSIEANPKVYSREAQFYTHWLNLPFVEQYPVIKSRYEKLREISRNWNAQHPQYPFWRYHDAIAPLFEVERRSSDITDARFSQYDQRYLDFNDILCERLASYSVAADTVSKMLAGAYANLCIMSRYRGDTPGDSRIANQFRFNVINKRTLGTISQAVMSKGIWDYVCAHSNILTGNSVYGAPMYSFPMWIVDIWGNRGDHEIDWRSYVNETKAVLSDSTIFQHYAVPSVLPSEDGVASIQNSLLTNMYGIISRYAYGEKAKCSNMSTDPTLGASMPRVENGATYTYKKDDINNRVPMNFDCQQYGQLANDNYDSARDRKLRTLDNFVDKHWRNYKFWESEYAESYSALLDVNSELSQFFIEMGWFEQPRNNVDIFKAISNLEYNDMATHAQNMVYRKTSRPSTSTIVKVDLPYGCDTYMSAGKLYVWDPRDNDDQPNYLQRFKLTENLPIGEELANAQRWPSLTPTILFHSDNYPDLLLQEFTGDDDVVDDKLAAASTAARVNGVEPFVWNTTPEYLNGSMPGLANQDAYRFRTDTPEHAFYDCSNPEHPATRNIAGMSHEDQGPGAAMIDLARSQSNGMARAELLTQGEDPDQVLQDIEHYAGVVVSEFPSKQWTFVQPLVDNTDIYQCGFNLWVNDDRIRLNKIDEVTAHFFKGYWLDLIDSRERIPMATDYVRGTFLEERGVLYNPMGTAYSISVQDTREDKTKPVDESNYQIAAFVTSERYRHLAKDVFIFVGCMPFTSPELAVTDIQAALPFNVVDTRWRGTDDLPSDPAYRALPQHIRGYREVTDASVTTWVQATAQGWDPGSTNQKLVVPWKSSGMAVKANDTVCTLLDFVNDISFGEFWSVVESRGFWEAVRHAIGSSNVVISEVKAPVAGTWYCEKGGKRVSQGAVIGRIVQKNVQRIVSNDVLFGRLFLHNKSVSRPDSVPGQPADFRTPVMAVDLYDAMTNLLNVSTAVYANNFGTIKKWMFDPAYGPVLPIVKDDMPSGYVARAGYINTKAFNSNHAVDLITPETPYMQLFMEWMSTWLPAGMDQSDVPCYNVPPSWGFNMLGPDKTNSHRWSRSIASISLDSVYVDALGRPQKGSVPIRRLDYQNNWIDSSLMETAEARITCASSGHLPSIIEAVKEANIAAGDQGIVSASSSGISVASAVAEPKPKTGFTKSPVSGRYGYRPMEDTRGSAAFAGGTASSGNSSESSEAARKSRQSSRRRHRRSGRRNNQKENTLIPKAIPLTADAGKAHVEENPHSSSSVASPSDADKAVDALKGKHDPFDKMLG